MGELRSKVHSACRWRRRKEDRPAEILIAALRLFSDKGFALTKLNDVAKEAGVSKGTLYLYFDGKEALFKAVINEFVLPQIAEAEEQAEQYSGSISDLMIELQERWQINVLETELSGIATVIVSPLKTSPSSRSSNRTSAAQARARRKRLALQRKRAKRRDYGGGESMMVYKVKARGNCPVCYGTGNKDPRDYTKVEMYQIEASIAEGSMGRTTRVHIPCSACRGTGN